MIGSSVVERLEGISVKNLHIDFSKKCTNICSKSVLIINSTLN